MKRLNVILIMPHSKRWLIKQMYFMIFQILQFQIQFSKKKGLKQVKNNNKLLVLANVINIIVTIILEIQESD